MADADTHRCFKDHHCDRTTYDHRCYNAPDHDGEHCCSCGHRWSA